MKAPVRFHAGYDRESSRLKIVDTTGLIALCLLAFARTFVPLNGDGAQLDKPGFTRALHYSHKHRLKVLQILIASSNMK